MSAKARRLVLWTGLGLALAAAVAYALRPQPVAVDMATVARGPLMVTVDEEGETRVKDVFVLSAPITGRALRIDLDVGDAVVADQTVVAEIEPIDPAFLDLRTEAQAKAAVRAAEAARALADAELEEAEAEFDFARADVERARALIRNETISERALEEAERAFRTTKAAVATARAALRVRDHELEQARALLLSPLEAAERHGPCECIPIRAPVGGSVLKVLHESAGVVEAGEPLAEIGDPEDLEVVVDLLSADAVKVEPGQRVIMEQWGGGVDLEGRVRRVEPTGFTKVSALGIEEQRVNVIIDFTNADERGRRLGHGYRVEARIVLWEGADVLKLPLSALFRDGDAWAVFVVVDGRAGLRHVRLGRRGGLEAEIAGGLEDGESVILHPGDRVVDDVPVVARS